MGYGAIAPIHAKVLQQLPHAEFYAVCDTDPAAIARCQNKYDVVAYSRLEDALKDDRISVFHLCTPHHLHFPMIEAILAAGKEVVVEKPVTRTKEEFTRLLQLDRSGKVCVILQNRYNACIQKLKQLICDGTLGQIQGIKGIMTWHKEPAYYESAPWKGKWETEGGSCLINQALHTLDLMVYFGGDVRTVQASMGNHSLQDTIETEDTVEAILHFENGSTGLLYASNAYCTNTPMEIEVVGTKATARYLYKKLMVNGSIVADDVSSADGQEYWGGGHYLLLEDYYEKGQYFSPNHIKPTMDALFGIYESANFQR